MSRPDSVLYSSLSHLRRLSAALLCTLILLTCASAQDAAAVPPLVKFGGTVSGAPAGTTGAIFALYKDQTGGAPLWQEVQNITLDANGRYTAYLGARSVKGLPLDLFSNGEARWLGVQPEGQPEQPRVLLVSVPYALKASDAETLGGLPASAFLRAEALSTAAPSAAYVNNAAVTTAVAGFSATPAITSGQAGYVSMFTNSTDLGNSALFQLAGANTTYLGFGTTTPSFNLHFVSQVDPAAIAIDGYGAVGVNFIGRRAEGTLAKPTAILLNDNIMAMQGRGYGTTGFSGGSRVYMKFFAAENWSDSNQGTYISLATTPAGGSTTVAERLRITAAGNIGIGTTTPAFPLSVNGAIQSLSGGFKFPDGTTQATAATAGVTSVTAADTTVTVGGTALAPTLAVNTTNIQKRVTGTCSSGSAIASVSSTGTVSCQTVSGGGAVSLPVSWTSTATAPAGVLNVTDTTNGPAAGNGAPNFAAVPSAIVGTATGTGVTAGVRGQATGTAGVGVVAYSTTSNDPTLVAWNGVTGYTASGSGGDWPKALYANITNVGGNAIRAEASATTAPVACTGNNTPTGCGQTVGVQSEVDATSGQTVAFEGELHSASAIGLQLDFDTAPTSGNMISAGVNCPSGNSCTYFTVDGNGNISTSGNINVAGSVNVTGNVNKSGGNFKIDHPLDPANKYLYHSFVESPDMMNIYNGVIVLDKRGKAVVQLPDYFEALNQDFRYQLTAVGAPGPNLFVASEIKGNQFAIAGGKPGAKVSWQVTGIRHDAYADAHRTIVEEDKGKERGTYMHPELFQQSPVLARK